MSVTKDDTVINSNQFKFTIVGHTYPEGQPEVATQFPHLSKVIGYDVMMSDPEAPAEEYDEEDEVEEFEAIAHLTFEVPATVGVMKEIRSIIDVAPWFEIDVELQDEEGSCVTLHHFSGMLCSPPSLSGHKSNDSPMSFNLCIECYASNLFQNV